MSTSPTTVTQSAVETEAQEGYELRTVDPRTILDNPDNARGKSRDRLGLTASIRALGILTPPLVREDENGSLVLIAGERRVHSAIEAGLTMIPVFVRSGMSDAHKLAGMLVENTDRNDLTVIEEAVTLQRLSGFEGMTTKAVAAMTGMKAATIRNAVKVAESETARTVAEKYSLTLEQAVALAEFEDDKDAVVSLTQYAVQNPEQFKHALSRLRVNRKVAEARSERVADLESKGVVVIDTPEWNDKSGVTRLENLSTADGKSLTIRNHAKCPGHVVALSRDGETLKPYCLNPAEYGHTSKYGETVPGAGAVGGGMTDDQKQERRTLIANNKAWKAAEIVRREHIVDVLARKTVPKGTLAFVTRDILSNPTRLDAPDALLTELTNVKGSEGYGHTVGVKVADKTQETRLPLALLAQVGASIESSSSTWRHPDSRQAGWFSFLVIATGYTLSEVEQIVVDGVGKEDA